MIPLRLMYHAITGLVACAMLVILSIDASAAEEQQVVTCWERVFGFPYCTVICDRAQAGCDVNPACGCGCTS